MQCNSSEAACVKQLQLELKRVSRVRDYLMVLRVTDTFRLAKLVPKHGKIKLKRNTGKTVNSKQLGSLNMVSRALEKTQLPLHKHTSSCSGLFSPTREPASLGASCNCTPPD